MSDVLLYKCMTIVFATCFGAACVFIVHLISRDRTTTIFSAVQCTVTIIVFAAVLMLL